MMKNWWSATISSNLSVISYNGKQKILSQKIQLNMKPNLETHFHKQSLSKCTLAVKHKLHILHIIVTRDHFRFYSYFIKIK